MGVRLKHMNEVVKYNKGRNKVSNEQGFAVRIQICRVSNGEKIMELLELGLEREEQGKGAKWNNNCG
jgi:hypothetical protein